MLLDLFQLVSSPFTLAIAFLVIVLTPIAGAPQQTTDTEPKVFEVIARRFAFEPATIEVVEGDRVRLLVRSADGPHGVEIKAFRVKKAVPRAKPGDSPITIEFVVPALASFRFSVRNIAVTATRT